MYTDICSTTFKRYHFEGLGMNPWVLDPCLFFKRTEEKVEGYIVTLVDNSRRCGNGKFSAIEEEMSKRFDVKNRETENLLRFSGLSISKEENHYKGDQQDYSTIQIF